MFENLLDGHQMMFFPRIVFHGCPLSSLKPICDKGLLRVGHPLNPSPQTDSGWFGDNKKGVCVSESEYIFAPFFLIFFLFLFVFIKSFLHFAKNLIIVPNIRMERNHSKLERVCGLLVFVVCLVDAFTFLLFHLGKHLNQDSFLILLQISWKDSCSTRISWFLSSSSRFVLLKTIALLRMMENPERCKFFKYAPFLRTQLRFSLFLFAKCFHY